MAYQSDAVLNITTTMTDQASDSMQNLSETIDETRLKSLELTTTLSAVGSAFTAIGGLVNQLDNPLAKTAATFLMTAGAISSTVAAIGTALPYIKTLIGTLRNLAIVQTIVAAMSGPVGWGKIAIGAAVAGAATAGIVAATGGFSGGQTQVVNINAQAFAGNQVEARQFGRQIQTISREETRLGR